MPISCVRVARGLLLFGEQISQGTLDREHFLEKVGVKNASFRVAGQELGATINAPGLRFFDSSKQRIAFGPGAGLVLGVSVGSASLRATLVDANGRLHHKHEGEPVPRQLSLKPRDLLDRIRDAATAVLAPALADSRLLVNGRLPLLGVSIAWGAPMDRRKQPVGPALESGWHNGQALDDRVARHLSLPLDQSHALADTHAAAIAVAFAQTRHPNHVQQRSPRLAIVMRLAGGVGGATIAVEPPDYDPRLGPTSGFRRSVLIGAGEFGHIPLNRAIIDSRGESPMTGLGPLKPHRCSCTDRWQRVPEHLEAYAATSAVAHRVGPGEPVCDVIRRMVRDPGSEIHSRALQDVGTLVGYALLGPVALLHPATITLTGSLALPPVRETVARSLSDAQVLGREPEVRLLSDGSDRAREVDDPTEDKFARAKGAALVVLRRRVHRRLEDLVEGRNDHVVHQVASLASPLVEVPW